MIELINLEDGRELLVSNERLQVLHLTHEAEECPIKFAIVLTDEMKEVILAQQRSSR